MSRRGGRRFGDGTTRARRAACLRFGVERLERRDVPAAIDFGMAIGIGSSGRSADVRANGIVADGAGNLLVTGSFAVAAGFDPNAPSALVAASGARDLFVAKYAPTGSLAWSRTFPGRATTTDGVTTRSVAQGSALAVDGAGNLFVSGTFSGTVDFDPGAGVTTLASPVRSDAFVLKLDGAGRFAWARALAVAPGGIANAQAVAADGAGGVYVGGSFGETLAIGTSSLAAGGLSDAFVARLDGGGQALWAVATRGAGASAAEARGLAVDPSGNVIAAGFVAGTADFDPGPGVGSIGSRGSYDASLWKLSPTGQLLWARGIGGADYDQANAVAVDLAGNAYVVGTYSLAVDFGTPARPDVLTAGGDSDVFVARYAPDGSEGWARGLVGSSGGSSQGRGIAVDAIGRVHVAGTFRGTVDFDPGPVAYPLSSVGYSDAFVAGYAGDGSLLYGLRAGQAGSTTALGVAVDAEGHASIAGPYAGAVAFGTIAVPAVGTSRFFVARVASGFPAPPPAPALQPASDTGSSASDRITAATSPRFDVAASSPANTIRLLRNGAVVAARVGSGVVVDAGPIPDGRYAYAAIEVNPQGVAGAVGAATPVTIDATPPTTPAAPALLAADDTGTVGDGATVARRPRLAGMAEPNATVSWIAADGTAVAIATASPTGSYTLQPPSALTNGSRAIRVRATDLAGNVGPTSPAFVLTIRTTDGDYDGDGRADVAVFRPGASTFLVLNSATGAGTTRTFGGPGDVPVPADYDGDGKVDVAVYRPANSTFYILGSAAGIGLAQAFGGPSDVPVPADYDGDGKADVAVYRPGNSTFYILGSASGLGSARAFGGPGDVPIPADYDGDGRADLAMFRPGNSTFFLLGSATGSGRAQAFGGPGDVPVPADYDGDGRADVAVFRPGNSTFYILGSTTNAGEARAFGGPGDVPVPADYDGDGKVDVAVYRPSAATSFILGSASGTGVARASGGVATDRPLMAPITSWYSFGTSGAMPRAAAPAMLVVATGTTVRGASARVLDRALQALALDRWRVDG